MREIYLSDLLTAARALLSAPPHQRVTLGQAMLKDADWADKFTKRLHKTHPLWGNGTLMAAARARPLQSEIVFSDPDYIACLVTILGCLERHRAEKACKSSLHAHINY